MKYGHLEFLVALSRHIGCLNADLIMKTWRVRFIESQLSIGTIV